MVKRIFMACLFFLFCDTTIFADTSSIPFSIEHWTLENKARVYFVRRAEVPILDVALVFMAGSAYDNKQLGIAAFTNSLIGEGAEKLTAVQIAEQFETVGAKFDRFVNRDMAGVTLRTMIDQQYLTPALHTFHTVIRRPTFPANTVQRVKNQLLARIKAQAQDPWQLAKDRFYQALYQNGPYAHNPVGTFSQQKSNTLAQVKAFYHRYYTGKNAYLILVGDISSEQARHIAIQLASDFPTGKTTQKPAITASSSIGQQFHVPYPTTQTTILMGQLGITRDNPNYFPLIVGNTILGDLPMSSLLFQDVREKEGLAYFANSAFDPLNNRGPFMIALQTKAANTQKALQLTQTILNTFIKEGPTQAQLEAARQYLVGQFPLTMATNANILTIVTNIAFYDRPLDYLNTYRKKIEAVTTSQIKNAFQQLVRPNQLLIVTVGPQAEKNAT